MPTTDAEYPRYTRICLLPQELVSRFYACTDSCPLFVNVYRFMVGIGIPL